MTTTQYTIVQHSGFGYAEDPTFAAAVETRSITTAAQRRAVEKAGGVLFNDYLNAEEFADRANYPDGHEGLAPKVLGTFADEQIDGLAIYVPVRQVIG